MSCSGIYMYVYGRCMKKHTLCLAACALHVDDNACESTAASTGERVCTHTRTHRVRHQVLLCNGHILEGELCAPTRMDRYPFLPHLNPESDGERGTEMVFCM